MGDADLPAEVREKTTRLIARMLRERKGAWEGSIAQSEGGTMSDKIKPHHLARKAILYVWAAKTRSDVSCSQLEHAVAGRRAQVWR